MLYTSIDQTIGNTPLVQLNRLKEELGLKANIYGKIEFFNPAGSVKDRIGKAMIDELEKQGKINKDTVLIEPTSGNTGIALASIATARGYKFGNIDIEKSDGKNFILADDNKTMICPFRTLDGLGTEVSKTIVEARNKKPFISIEDFQTRGKVSQTIVAKLKELHVLDELPETSQLSLF